MRSLCLQAGRHSVLFAQVSWRRATICELASEATRREEWCKKGVARKRVLHFLFSPFVHERNILLGLKKHAMTDLIIVTKKQARWCYCLSPLSVFQPIQFLKLTSAGGVWLIIAVL